MTRQVGILMQSQDVFSIPVKTTVSCTQIFIFISFLMLLYVCLIYLSVDQFRSCGIRSISGRPHPPKKRRAETALNKMIELYLVKP